MNRSIILILGLCLLASCAGTSSSDPPQAAAPPPGDPQPGGTAPPPPAPSKSAAAGRLWTDLKVGTGPVAKKGQRLKVHYVGTLTNGSTFDSSTGGQPFVFTLGGGQVIRGWDEGLPGMKVGGKRRLVIPPELAYGASGAPPKIPPNATLVFEIDLLGIE